MGRSRALASRWLALTVLCAAMMMIILDGTIVTVALPAIQRDLGFSSSGLAWVVNAYLIAFGGLLLLAGRLGDLIGGKRVFLAGLAVFIVASLLCGVSVSQPMLIAARFAQGAGGAMASAVSLGMIVRLFPEPPLRARALGIYSFTGAGGASVGLVLGGVLTRSRDVSGANVVQALTVAAAFGFQVLIPQYMQRVLGYGAAEAGVGMLPAAVVIGGLSAGLSARLIARFGLRLMLVAGLAPIVIGFALLTRLPAAGSYPLHLLPTMLLLGGFGLAFPAMITLAMSGVPDSDAGVASGLVNTTQQVGAALGVAVLSTLAAARTGHLLAAGRPDADALTGGYQVAFGTGAGLAAAALVLAAVVLRPRAARRPAESPDQAARTDQAEPADQAA